MSVADPLLGARSPVRVVAVLHQRPRRVNAARAEVYGQHWLDAGEARPVDELVRADLVALDRAPGEVEASRPLLEWPDTVLPVIAGDEVSAGVANDRGAEFAGEVEHVRAKPVPIGGWVRRFVDPRVHAPAEMLDERPEEPRVDGSYCEGGVGGELS